MCPKLENLQKEYVNIQKEIFNSEKDGTFETKKQEIYNRINRFVSNLEHTFSNIDKNDIQSILTYKVSDKIIELEKKYPYYEVEQSVNFELSNFK